MRIAFLGDIMPGGLLHYKEDVIERDVLNYLKEYDLRVACLEAAIGDKETFDPTKMTGRMNIIYARNSDLRHLTTLGINVVSLANNHAYDLDGEGLINTINLLDEMGMAHCGAGRNLEEARKPAVVEIGGKKIAILAACQHGTVYVGHVHKATEDGPGINPLDIDTFCADIREMRKSYDYVIVMPHWGIEYSYLPTLEIKEWAKRMIDAGADAVIGGHPHNIQPIIEYKGKPIFFSLGNFMFPDFHMRPPRLICYPDSEEARNSSVRVWHYPDKVDVNSVSVWHGRARIGMIASITLNGSDVKAHYRLTYLSADNKVGFYDCPNNRLKRLRMWLMGKMIKSSHFHQFDAMYSSRYNLPRRALHALSRWAGINYDVKIKL